MRMFAGRARLCLRDTPPHANRLLDQRSAVPRHARHRLLLAGLALAIAPVGAWVAVAGNLTLVPLTLGAAVVCWLVGFDTIYALQDADFDKNAGLYSLPVRFGAKKALWIGRVSHVLMILCLGVLGKLAGLHGWYFTGVGLAAALIATEHALISPTDLKRLNIAFFNVNIAVSCGLLLFTAIDLLRR